MAKSPYVHENLPDDDEVLKDGAKRTIPMMMRDSVAREVGLADGASLHRPGQRFSVDAAARARVEQARAEGIKEMCDAWKTPPSSIEANTAPPKQDAVPRTITMDEAQRIKDAAWLQSVIDLESAWKGPAR